LQLIIEAWALVNANNVDGNNFEKEKDGEWDHVKSMDI
jgi:hypothetical protein